ncbi:MAG: calcium/sodium antiporter [Alphaproteobacteria bacterium]|nr:calcium/sodium antiporter [Alphaproteobacteria bacterium]
MVDIFFVISGLAILLIAGEATLRGAIGLARSLNVSPAVIGMTVVGLGTSLPELVVCIDATIAGKPDFAVGNVIGSNISNTLLILGAAAVILPLACDPRAVRRDGTMMVVAIAIACILGVTGETAAWQGLLMLLALAGFMAWSYVMDRRHRSPATELHEREAEGIPVAEIGGARILIYVVAGLAGLTGGATLLVDGAEGIARSAGVPDYIIGLTILAIGTSLPELVASIVAALRGHGDVAIANVLGSNMINVLGILGATSLITTLPFAPEIRTIDIWVMAGSTIVLIPILITGWRIARSEGLLLLAGYAGYIASIAYRL